MSQKLTPSLFTHLVILVFMMSLSCSSTRKSTDSTDKLNAFVTEKIGGSYVAFYNASKSHGLFIEKRTDDHAEKTLKYIVVRLNDRSLSHEGNFSLGGVKWKDDLSIEVTTFSSVRDEVGTKKIVIITDLR